MGLRSLYRKLVPYQIRASLWYLRNLGSYIFSDKMPAQWSFDYDAYWKQREEKKQAEISYSELVQICVNLIPEGCRLLDLGCGSGEFLRKLEKSKDIEGVGVDISKRAVALARKKGTEAYVFDVSKQNLAILGKFDVITIFELLEHVSDPESLLLNLRRSLPKATVIVSIPNTGYIADRLRLLLGRFPCQWIIHPSEHLRFWTLHDFKLMADGVGYKISTVLHMRGTPILAKRWPSLFAEDLIFVLSSENNRDRSKD